MRKQVLCQTKERRTWPECHVGRCCCLDEVKQVVSRNTLCHWVTADVSTFHIQGQTVQKDYLNLNVRALRNVGQHRHDAALTSKTNQVCNLWTLSVTSSLESYWILCLSHFRYSYAGGIFTFGQYLIQNYFRFRGQWNSWLWQGTSGTQ